VDTTTVSAWSCALAPPALACHVPHAVMTLCPTRCVAPESKGTEGAGDGSESDDSDNPGGKQAEDAQQEEVDPADVIFREYDTKSALVVQRWLWSPEDRRHYEREQEVRWHDAFHTCDGLAVRVGCWTSG